MERKKLSRENRVCNTCFLAGWSRRVLYSESQRKPLGIQSQELLNSTKYDNFTTGGIVMSTARIPHLPDHERRGGLKIHWIHSVP